MFLPLDRTGMIARPILLTILLISVAVLDRTNVLAQARASESQHSARNTTTSIPERDRQVYDIVFPRRSLQVAKAERFVLILRYWLARGGDFQYTLTKQTNGVIKVNAIRTFQPVHSYINSGYPLVSLTDQEFAAVKELAKTIPTEKSDIELAPEKADALMSGFRSACQPSLTDLDVIHFDGTSYDVWLDAGNYTLSYALSGESVGSKKFLNPLVQWMNEVHKTLSSDLWNGNSSPAVVKAPKP